MNLFPVLLIGAVGAGAFLLGRKKGETATAPPTVEDVPETPAGTSPTDEAIALAQQGARALLDAVAIACPGVVSQSTVDAFERAVTVDPRSALGALRDNVSRACPSLTIPGLTSPRTTSDAVTPQSATALALEVQAVGGCPPEALVRRFQGAWNAEKPNRLLVNGLYDFETAVAVQTLLTAAGAGLAPQVCAFPEFSASDFDALNKAASEIRTRATDLLEKVSQ